MKKQVRNLVMICLIIAGVGTICHPFVISYLVERDNKEIIRHFNEIVVSIEESRGQSGEGEESAVQDEDLDRLYSDMQAYNKEIYEMGQASLTDPFSYETPAFDLKEYGFRDDILGYISIPRMNVELPVYLGATTENMAKGAVNLGMTSIPIGGVNTNSVIAAHRGYSGAGMFRDIELLQIGDLIYITNLWETLTYEVVETKVILPTDIDEVFIQEGRDMLTLITCHPYTQNYQRYVVYCEHMENASAAEPSDADDNGLELKYLFRLDELSKSQRLIFAEKWVPIGIAGVLLLLITLRGAVGLWNNKRAKKSK